jgi:hypothetical protein
MPKHVADVPAGGQHDQGVVRPTTRRTTSDEADVTPPAAIEAEERADEELEQDDDREAGAERQQVLGRDDELEAHQPRERVTRREDHGVKEEQEGHPDGCNTADDFPDRRQMVSSRTVSVIW